MVIIKRVNSRGQVVLGKQYAGRHALVEEPEPGVWIVKLGNFVPAGETSQRIGLPNQTKPD